MADLRGLERKLSLRLFLFLWSLAKGSIDCLGILRRRHPHVVVGGGGYVSWAPVFTAWLTRRPTLIVELDSHMGLANRVLVPFVDRVCTSFVIPGREGGKYLYAGRPLGDKLLGATAEAGREFFGLKPDMPVVLVTGGSLGARSINLACVEAFGSGPLPFQLIHVSGKRDYDMVEKRLQEAGADRENYHLLDYTGDLPLATAAASLVVGRSGASILELAALGKPALLVPYPYATGDHQRKNAEWMAGAGAAEVLEDDEVSGETLKSRVSGLISNTARLADMASASARLGKRGAAERIADEIFELAGRSGSHAGRQAENQTKDQE
jgi:UDP-N-acetylglucosamine--N-acetylmuramyl-(pentapeptide) pyrophosphoryl-undecaprenol N-acetylglucosamine transferase